jgi:hypothetical protein
MFENREKIEKWFHEVVEKFRQKGALSPDKAMTVEELGLPARFEVAMKGRLDRLGVFVEVDGKYYLWEERLKQIGVSRRKNCNLGSEKEHLDVENSSSHRGCSVHGFLLGELPCSELGLESHIAPLPCSLASYICAADLLFVKDQEENVFKRTRGRCVEVDLRADES